MSSSREDRLSLFIVILVGSAASKCPESRIPHPTNCTLFFNCVNLPRDGYVWVPSKCSEGLVFQSYLQMCALPSETWNCNSFSQTTTVKKKHEAELIRSYLDFSSDPSNFSEIKDLSYPLDSTTDGEIIQETTLYSSNEEVFSNPLTKNENKNFNNNKAESFLDNKSNEKNNFSEFENKTFLTSNVILLIQLFNNSSVTNSKLKSVIKTEHSVDNLVNKKDSLLNRFVVNYIIKNSIENKDENLSKETELEKSTTKNKQLMTATSNIRMESTSAVGQLNNKPKDTGEIIVVQNNLGKKQYFTVEKYEFLKNQLKSELVDIIPCLSGIRLPNNTDCTKYYICEPKTATLRKFSCPIYTGFNENSRICDTQTYSLCKKIKNENLNFSVDLNKEFEKGKLIRKTLCETAGKIADPSSSSHYYLCYSNNEKISKIESVRMMCPNNLIFCAEKKVCTRQKFCT